MLIQLNLRKIDLFDQFQVFFFRKLIIDAQLLQSFLAFMGGQFMTMGGKFELVTDVENFSTFCFHVQVKVRQIVEIVYPWLYGIKLFLSIRGISKLSSSLRRCVEN